VRFNQLVTGLKKIQSSWFVQTTGAAEGPFDWVLVTVPAAQAYDFLPEMFEPKMHLEDVTMQPCFTLMLGYPVQKPFDWDAAFISNSILSWVSINSSKPNRGAPFTVVAMSKNEWAEESFDRPESSVMAEMLAELERVSGVKLNDAAYLKLKRWKYANALRQDQPLELIDYSAQLACCGDWCISGRVESAFMSSFQVANKLRDVIV